MSIQKKLEHAVTLLVAQLDKTYKEHLQGARDANEIQSLSSKFGDFKTEVESMRDVFPDIKTWEKPIMDQFYELEQQLDDDIFKDSEKKPEVEDKLDLMTRGIRNLRKSIPMVDRRISRLSTMSLRTPSNVSMNVDHQMSWPESEWVDPEVEKKILESEAMSSFFASFHCLSGCQQAKMCSLCLSVFPMNSIIEKKPLIYWWIGEGLVMKSYKKTAEEVGEQVFKELVDEGFIRPSSENKSKGVSSFVIDSWIHRMLILIAKENSHIEFSPQWTPRTGKRQAFIFRENDNSSNRRISGDKEAEDLIMIFNVNNQYLGMKPEWLSKLRKVEVLQMGRWQNSVRHHIEVIDQKLFDALGSQKHLKYLSLRGISRIETLPDSISDLISLQILDLQACHNLEKLPPTISRLKKLTHLDVSHCYLLESMPKGLEHLVDLQVVKGFVIGKADKNSGKISDLSKLEKLRKLSIRVGKTQQDQGRSQDQDQNTEQSGTTNRNWLCGRLESFWNRARCSQAQPTKPTIEKDGELDGLSAIRALRILTISWGAVSSAQLKSISLPKELTKLDLRCVPFESLPEWLSQANLPSNLSKLYIRGGKLRSLEKKDGQDWKVKYLRLKYLTDMDGHELKMNEGELGNYKYLDQFDCYKHCPDA